MTQTTDAAISNENRIADLVDQKAGRNLKIYEESLQAETPHLHPPALYFDRRARATVPSPTLTPIASSSFFSSSDAAHQGASVVVVTLSQ